MTVPHNHNATLIVSKEHTDKDPTKSLKMKNYKKVWRKHAHNLNL